MLGSASRVAPSARTRASARERRNVKACVTALLLLALAIAIAAIEQLDAAIRGRGRRRRGKPQLQIDEARQFQAACLEHADRDVGAVLALGYLLLGARAGEIVLREVRDADDGGRVLWIPDSKTRAGRRELGVPEPLEPHLARLVGGRLPGAPLLERR